MNPRGAQTYNKEIGRAFPMLTFAQGRLRSAVEVWRQPSGPINPTAELASKYSDIAMDQRNAGGHSRAPRVHSHETDGRFY